MNFTEVNKTGVLSHPLAICNGHRVLGNSNKGTSSQPTLRGEDQKRRQDLLAGKQVQNGAINCYCLWCNGEKEDSKMDLVLD